MAFLLLLCGEISRQWNGYTINSDEGVSKMRNINQLPALATLARGRDTLTNAEAASAINRAPQTLRIWACLENGPIRPIRIKGRLAWRVSDLQALLSGEVV